MHVPASAASPHRLSYFSSASAAIKSRRLFKEREVTDLTTCFSTSAKSARSARNYRGEVSECCFYRRNYGSELSKPWGGPCQNRIMGRDKIDVALGLSLACKLWSTFILFIPRECPHCSVPSLIMAAGLELNCMSPRRAPVRQRSHQDWCDPLAYRMANSKSSLSIRDPPSKHSGGYIYTL